MLEGVEVVFIVVAIGAGGTLIVPAALGAAVALLAVVVLGLALHRPLASLPENKLKFGVGVLLSAFGTFWVGEGIGMHWPGGDWAILVLTSLVAAVAVLLVAACRRLQRRQPIVAASSAPGADGEPAARLRGKPSSRLRTALAQTWKLFILRRARCVVLSTTAGWRWKSLPGSPSCGRSMPSPWSNCRWNARRSPAA